MRISRVAILLVLTAAVICDNPWKLCPGADLTKIDVSKVTANPWPIQKAKPCKFEIFGTAKTNISQKNGRMDVYSAGTKMFSTAVGSSATATAGGNYYYTFTYTLPSFVPPGNYDVDFSMIGNDGSTLTCVVLELNF